MNRPDGTKSIRQLLQAIPGNDASTSSFPDVMVTGIAFDSRNVERGSLFVALSGGQLDGHRFISDAIKKGAVIVVGSKKLADIGVPYIQVDDTRSALAQLSAAFYDFPARKLTVIGVTGTDGKTTTTNIIYQILLAAGLKVGMISTVNAVIAGEELDTGFHVTTPESPFIQRYLAQMVQAGLTHVIIEATSHGLAQKRVEACEFDIGVVTNITHEHLDYHGTNEDYRAAKSILFTDLEKTVEKEWGNLRLSVLNYDDQSYSYLNQITRNKIVYSQRSQEVDIHAEDIKIDKDGISFTAVAGEKNRIAVKTSLIGEYNISNCLAAIAATVLGLGVEPQAASQGISNLHSITGRMERIDMGSGQKFLAIVDFAHTPNALMRALETARKLTERRVIAVFGSAGLRDRQKRRLMADTSAKLADYTILTAEDPRTESLDEILAEMADASRNAGGVENETFLCIADRGEAIFRAVQMAEPGDIVIACGKGHEQSMCFGETEYPWDDKTAMKAAIARLLGIEGPEMPYLPTQGK